MTCVDIAVWALWDGDPRPCVANRSNRKAISVVCSSSLCTYTTIYLEPRMMATSIDMLGRVHSIAR